MSADECPICEVNEPRKVHVFSAIDKNTGRKFVLYIGNGPLSRIKEAIKKQRAPKSRGWRKHLRRLKARTRSQKEI